MISTLMKSIQPLQKFKVARKDETIYENIILYVVTTRMHNI